LAKGVLAPKSKFLSALETFSESELIFYHKTTTELFLLSQATLLKSHLRLADRAEVFPYAAAICEVTEEWIKGEEKNLAYFQLLVKTLENLEKAEVNQAPKLFWFFVYFGASILGFRPNLETCFRCGKKEWFDKAHHLRESYLFHPEKGGLVCAEDARESERYLKVSSELKNLAGALSKSDFETAAQLEIPSKLVKALSEFLKDFLLVQEVWKEVPRSLGLGKSGFLTAC